MKMITRKIDSLGRIVLPIDLRKKLGLIKQSEVLIESDNDYITIKRSAICCKLCGSAHELDISINICGECVKKIKSL